MDHQIAPPVGRHMHGVLDHFDAAEMAAVVVAQKLVVVAGDVDYARALARLAQELLDNVVMSLRPVPGRFQRPSVHDVADQEDRVRIVVAQEFDKPLRLASAGAEMNVGEKQRANADRTFVFELQRQRGCDIHAQLIGDLFCASMTVRNYPVPTSFSPMIPVAMSATHSRRVAVVGSPKATIPTITVPATPMPHQTA